MKPLILSTLPLLLLSPDDVGGGVASDPLDTDVGSIDTSFPRLMAGNYELKCLSAKREPAKKFGERLTLVFENIKAERSTTGTDIPPGKAKIFHYIGITPRAARTEPNPETGKLENFEEYTTAMIARSVAAPAKSARMTVTPRQILDNPAMLEGQIAFVKVGVQKETAEFGESNKIKEFLVR